MAGPINRLPYLYARTKKLEKGAVELQSQKIGSVITGEPTGSTVINNMVSISVADRDTAVGAGLLIATTLYIVTP